MKGILKLPNKVFNGKLYGGLKSVSGELVFTTSLVGYNESITDPSYKNQILVFTNPLIGNYGVPGQIKENNMLKYFESNGVHVSGIIIGNYSDKYNHWNAVESLSQFCKKNGVPILSDIDTRMLTTYLREHGVTNGKIGVFHPPTTEEQSFKESDQVVHPITEVSTKSIIKYNVGGKIKIKLIDCGTKNNIIRCLIERDCQVDLVPYNTEINIKDYHGILIGNGPGDPREMTIIIENLKKIIGKHVPIMGICAGHQLLGLSVGFDIYKMKFGHRSHNAPVIDTFTNKTYISSQNHGYCISNKFVPNDWQISYINGNDQTVEGIRHKYLPYFSVQFHPENFSGPKDTEFLFDEFINKCKNFNKNKNSNLYSK
jgi:carbamoyl-phosphate synthase small subunit